MTPAHSEQIVARTIKEFCRAYGVGHTKAYELIAQGKLEARKAGRRTLIMEASARKWLEECEEIQAYPCSYPSAKQRINADGDEQPRKRKYHKSRIPKQVRAERQTVANGSGE